MARAEMRLLLITMRRAAGRDDDVVLAGLLSAGVDWSQFLRLVDRHRVAPVVHRTLKPWLDRGVTLEQLRSLRDRVAANTRQALLQVAELRRLQQQLQGHNLPWLVFKGPLLAMQAYGGLAARHAGDVDVLVPVDAVGTVGDLLRTMDYVRACPGFDLSPRQSKAYRRHFTDFAFVHRRHGLSLELHWRLFRNPHLLPLEARRLIAEGAPLRIAGLEVLNMAARDLLIYLCAHGAKHGWFRLFWLLDVHVLLDVLQPAEQRALLERARQLGAERMLLQAAWLAQHLLLTRVDTELLQAARQDAAVKYLVAMALDAMAGPAVRWREERGRSLGQAVRIRVYACRLRKGWRYRWSEVAGNFVHWSDWSVLRLPDALFFLYLPLRPLLRLWRQWGWR